MNIPENNVSRLELSSLRALDALLSERSVTRAAAQIGLSQPAMSAQLRRLREIFNDPILVRVKGGLAPTPRASLLALRVADILDRTRDLLEVGVDEVTPELLDSHITIMATDYVQHVVLTEIVERLRDEAPRMRLEFRSPVQSRTREFLESGNVDLGIGPGTVPTGQMRFSKLYQDKAACILSKQFFDEDEDLTLDRFCELPHVVTTPPKYSFFDQAVDHELKQHGRTRQVALTIQGSLLVPKVVREGPLVATLPARLLKRMFVTKDLWVFSPPIDLPEMTIGMYWHERTHFSPVHRWFRSLVKESLRRSD